MSQGKSVSLLIAPFIIELYRETKLYREDIYWHVSSNLKGYGVSLWAEVCSSRSGSKKLHVCEYSNLVFFREKNSVTGYVQEIHYYDSDKELLLMHNYWATIEWSEHMQLCVDLVVLQLT